MHVHVHVDEHGLNTSELMHTAQHTHVYNVHIHESTM